MFDDKAECFSNYIKVLFHCMKYMHQKSKLNCRSIPIPSCYQNPILHLILNFKPHKQFNSQFHKPPTIQYGTAGIVSRGIINSVLMKPSMFQLSMFQPVISFVIVCILAHFISNSEYTRIMLIGDSVDRNSNNFWCRKNEGKLCLSIRHPHDMGALDLMDKVFCNAKVSSGDKSFRRYFAKLDRHHHWSIEMCFIEEKSIIISFIFNMYGLITSLHPNVPSTGMNKAFTYGKIYNINKFLDSSLMPAIKAIENLTSGSTDGILIQSHFWDIKSAYMTFQLMPNSNGYLIESGRNTFLQKWKNQAKIFIQAIKSKFINSSYISWRSPNPLIYNSNEVEFFLFKDVNQKLLQPMREIGQNIAMNIQLLMQQSLQKRKDETNLFICNSILSSYLSGEKRYISVNELMSKRRKERSKERRMEGRGTIQFNIILSSARVVINWLIRYQEDLLEMEEMRV
eukprot:gene9565-19871_t